MGEDSAAVVYTDEIFENQRKGLKGWSCQLLITDREAFSDRAGDGFRRDPAVEGPLSMLLPHGWKWTSEWYVDKTYTECDSEGWSYAKTFSSIDKKAYEQQSKGTCSTLDCVRRRRWIRTRERTSSGGVVLDMAPSSAGSVGSPGGNVKQREEFGQESKCHTCKSKFTLFKRRHHCRRCYKAVCNECSQKVVLKDSTSKRGQPYCTSCIDEDEALRTHARTSARRNSIAPPSLTSIPAVVPTPKSNQPKFCIECGNDLPSRVKFCIQCGASARASAPSQPSESPSPRLAIEKDCTPAYPSPRTPVVLSQSPKPAVAVVPAAAANHGFHSNNAISPNHFAAENESLRLELETLRQKLRLAENNLATNASKPAETSTQKTKDRDSKRYAPYFDMVRNGIPTVDIKLKMTEEGLDPELLDVAGSSSSSPAASGSHIPEEYVKFFKLLKMGMPMDQVKLKVQANGLDPNVLDSSAPLDNNPSPAIALVTKVRDDPEYAKYLKLLKMGMPVDQVKLKMSSAGLKPELLDTPDAPIASRVVAPSTEGNNKGTPTVKDCLEYEKYFKLLRMGMPPVQVKLKMEQAGLDPNLLDTPDAPAPLGSSASTSSVAVEPSSTSSGTTKDAAGLASLAKVQPTPKLEKNQSQEPEVTLPKKAPVKPRKEMRTLFWTRIPMNIISQTVWMNMSDENVNIDANEIEWMFRKKNESAAKKGDDVKRKEVAKALPEKVLLLDPKRQQNVGIAIARFRMPAAEIKAALLSLDEKKLTVENLQALISIEPTVEEQDMINNYDGDPEQLGNIEKFFQELLTIPRFTQRIKCFRLKRTFEDRILETQTVLDTLGAALDQLGDSKKLRKVLETVLAIGNYMNGSTPRGGAYGFKLDVLTQLHTIKSVDPKISLMHFLARHLEEHNPELITFPADLPQLNDAKRLSLNHLRGEVNVYNAELTMLQGQVRASQNAQDKNDKFYEVMNPFALGAIEIKDEVLRDVSMLEQSFTDLVTSFGEDARKMDTTDFFTLISDFIEEFKKAYRQNQTNELKVAWDHQHVQKDEAEEEERALTIEQEKKEKREFVTGEEAKTLYAHVISIITARAMEMGQPKEVDQFKAMSKKYGSKEIDADQFCNYMGRTFGARLVVNVVPDMAKLLPDKEKRGLLLEAHARLVETIKRDRDEKRERRGKEAAAAMALEEERLKKEAELAMEKKSKVKAAVESVLTLKIENILPVVGEEAHQLHKSILEAVQHAFQGDAAKTKEFSQKARHFGSEQISASDFYKYLTDSFESEFVARLVPDLARLLQDLEKRHSLLKALCESAPGWARFAGL